MFFFNPWGYYIANDKMPDLDFSSNDDKEYFIIQGILVSILLISTVIIHILANSVEYKYGSLFAVILMTIISLFFTIMWIKDFLKWRKKLLKKKYSNKKKINNKIIKK